MKIQSGVLLNDLAQDAEKQGLLYPPDPGEKFATVGGNVATNAGGMRAVKYGLSLIHICFLCDQMATRASFAASVDVKRILREKIYDKLLRLGASYREHVSTSEVVQDVYKRQD